MTFIKQAKEGNIKNDLFIYRKNQKKPSEPTALMLASLAKLKLCIILILVALTIRGCIYKDY